MKRAKTAAIQKFPSSLLQFTHIRVRWEFASGEKGASFWAINNPGNLKELQKWASNICKQFGRGVAFVEGKDAVPFLGDGHFVAWAGEHGRGLAHPMRRTIGLR